LEKGEGLKQDLAAAARWYRLAAEAGHAAAQKKLADFYASGQGVVQDFGEARKWYAKAAAGGIAGAGLRRTSAVSTNADGQVESADPVKSDPPATADAKKN
jgi:TPR repeat protein